MTRQKPEPNILNEAKESSREADIVENERKKYIVTFVHATFPW